MAGTGSYFQTYLKRALANLEATDRERKVEAPTSPSSESMSGGELFDCDVSRDGHRYPFRSP